MNELKPEDVMRELEAWIYDFKGTATQFCALRDATALLREKDALIEDYRQELGRARVALNDANAEIERLRKAKYIYSTVDYCADDFAKAQEEIERLHRVSAETSDRNFRILEATKKSCEARINLAIREAITEFAQRLKARYNTLPHYCDTTKEVLAIVNGSIDKIAKEMKGDQDA